MVDRDWGGVAECRVGGGVGGGVGWGVGGRTEGVVVERLAVVEGVVGVVVVIVLDRLAASHTVTHVVVRPHVQLVHRAPVLFHPRALTVEQRPTLPRPRGHRETGGLVARVAWTISWGPEQTERV